MSSVVPKILKALDEVGPEIALAHTKTLQAHAKEAGWHPDHVKALSVTATPHGTYKVDVKAHAVDGVIDHEFGTQNRQPSPAIRGFLSTLDAKHTERALKGKLRGVI